jgi:hypothetical protein
MPERHAESLIVDEDGAVSELERPGVHANGHSRNMLTGPHRHGRSLRQEADGIVPLRPRVLNLSLWQGRERSVAITAVVLIVLSVVFLIRPISWEPIGGLQPMPGVMTVPRLYTIFVPVAMAVASFVIMRSLLQIRHWSRYFGIFGLAVLAVDAGALSRNFALTLIAGRTASVPPAALHAATQLAIYGLLASLAAIVSACLSIGSAAKESRRRKVAPWLMGAAFALPVGAYLASIQLPAPVLHYLYQREPSLNSHWPASSAMASAVFIPYQRLLYMGVVLAAWQAVTFSQAINEAGPKIAYMMRRVPQFLLLILAAAKLLFDIFGYLHRLPADLGGDAPIWDLGVNSWVWPVAVLLTVPAAVVLLRRVKTDHLSPLPAIPVVILAALFSLFGPVQVVSQALDDFVPRLGIHPAGPLGVLFVAPTVLFVLAAALTLAGLVYYWNRNRAAAALFGLSFVIQLPGALNDVLREPVPVPGLGHIDAIISAATFAWCLLAVVRVAPPVPIWLWALWIGFTILVHFNTLLPGSVQTAFFTVAVILPLAYTLLWAADPVNKAAKDHAPQATLALGLMAMLLLLICVQVWVGDRFGRANNTFVINEAIFQEGARQQIAIPLLAVLTWLYALKLGTKPASRKKAHPGAHRRRQA